MCEKSYERWRTKVRKWGVEERETINKASPRNVQEGGGRERERERGREGGMVGII